MCNAAVMRCNTRDMCGNASEDRKVGGAGLVVKISDAYRNSGYSVGYARKENVRFGSARPSARFHHQNKTYRTQNVSYRCNYCIVLLFKQKN